MVHKHSQANYWFKRRRYGLGWVPVTWQGILLLAAYLACLFGSVLLLPAKPASPDGGQIARCISLLVLATIIFVGLARRHAPAPRWRWGRRDNDNPRQDF